MKTYLDESLHLERDERSLEQMAAALDRIADALDQWCKLEQAKFEKQYPVKRNPLDATITHIPTADEQLKASQGASDEPIEEWIGLNEQEFLARPERPPAKPGATKKTVSTKTAGRKSD